MRQDEVVAAAVVRPRAGERAAAAEPRGRGGNEAAQSDDACSRSGLSRLQMTGLGGFSRAPLFISGVLGVLRTFCYVFCIISFNVEIAFFYIWKHKVLEMQSTPLWLGVFRSLTHEDNHARSHSGRSTRLVVGMKIVVGAKKSWRFSGDVYLLTD